MALTEEFNGSAVPAGWTFEDSGVGGASVAVSGGRCHITLPSGGSQDGISNATNTDNTGGIVHALGSADLDFAVQLDSEIGTRRGRQFNLHVRGNGGTPGDGRTAQEMVRYAFYANSVGSVSRFILARSGGASTTVINTSFEADTFHGNPGWARVRYVHSTGVWTFFWSTDGFTWNTLATHTRSMTLEGGSIKVGMGDINPEAAGGTIRIGQTVDVDAAGTTDLRESLVSYERQTISTIDGTDGALAAGWTDDSANGGTVTWTGTAMRLTQTSTDQSRGRVRWTGPHHERCGLLVKFTSGVATHGNVYFVPGVGNEDDSGTTDQYVHTPGYGIEITTGGTGWKWVRRDWRTTVGSPTDMDSAYAFLKSTTEPSVSLGGTHWVRVEKVDRRVRMRAWLDGDDEPSTWQFDGQDEIVDGPFAPTLGVAHNDGLSVPTAGVDVLSAEFYLISDHNGIEIVHQERFELFHQERFHITHKEQR